MPAVGRPRHGLRCRAVRRGLSLCIALALAAGCGGEEQPPPAAATATATPTPNPTTAATPVPEGSGANAFIGSLAVDPRDGTLFLGTGLGLFRQDGGAKKARRIVGELRTADGSGPVSSNLVVRFAGPGVLLASGHPEGGSALPENLGLIRSRDRGRTWEPVSDLGESDFHILQVAGERIAAVRAEETDVEISRDGGGSWESRTPPDQPLDVAFDPRDGARMAIATEQGIFISADEGRSWRQRDALPSEQLAWVEPDALYRADPGGSIKLSSDGGRSWREVGTVDISVNELAADADGALYASVPGGEVRRSTDGGKTWERHLRLE
jgi:hypothetical protein